MFGFLKRNQQRAERAEKDAADAEDMRKEVDARWPEIRRQAAWADDTPVDVLTERFLQSLHGGNA